MLFHVKPNRAVIGDINARLVNCYSVIRDDIDGLIEELASIQGTENRVLAGHVTGIDLRSYYDRVKDEFNASTTIDTRNAALFIYLNARCFNGLYRESSTGKYNSPFGGTDKKQRSVYDERNLRKISGFLKSGHIDIIAGDYRDISKHVPANAGAFFFLDPPYFPISETASFTQYSTSAWKERDFKDFRAYLDGLHAAGFKFLACNSDTPVTRELFHGYTIRSHAISRYPSCKGNTRRPVKELVVMNYAITTLDAFIAGTAAP
jgi:DNA adenine methylase